MAPPDPQPQPPARLPARGHESPYLGKGAGVFSPHLGAGGEEDPSARPALLGATGPPRRTRPGQDGGDRHRPPPLPGPRRCPGNRPPAGGASSGEGAVARKQPRRRRGAAQHADTAARGEAVAPGPTEPFRAMELEDDFGEARGGVKGEGEGEGGCGCLLAAGRARPGPAPRQQVRVSLCALCLSQEGSSVLLVILLRPVFYVVTTPGAPLVWTGAGL